MTQQGDPFVGFSRQVPLFEPADPPPTTGSAADISAIRMKTASGKLVWFNPQTFPKKKPVGTRRIFCLGGSTTYGRPFADSTSFCGWLRRFLPIADPSQNWEVINAGGISYASYRVAAVMEELAQYEPDLFIVLSAHNEFLERRTYASMFESDELTMELNALLQKTRTWSLVSRMVGRSVTAEVDAKETLPEEVDEILNHSAGPKDYHRDDRWAEQVLHHYEFNLSRMVRIARDAGAEILFLTPASNLRNCSPFKSESGADLSDDQREEIRVLQGLIESELREQHFEQALTLCEQIVQVDPRDALAQYLYGKSLFALQRWDQAERAFRRAIDEDVCPLRATTMITETVRRVAGENQTHLVDFEARLRERSIDDYGHACFGAEYFLDHVHPTIDVHGLIALWIVEELQGSGWLPGETLSEIEIAAVQRNVEAEIDVQTQGIAFRNLAKVLHWAGKFDEAAPRARDAIRLLPGELESRYVLADCLQQTGRSREALAQYRELFELGDFPRAYLPYGELLSEQGELLEAKSYLMRAILADREDHRIRAHYELGLVHLQLGEFEFALQSLRESDRHFPNDPATLVLIAEAELGLGDWETAVKELLRVTTIDPNNFYAHDRLAEVFLEHGRLEEAQRHVDAAVRLEPDNVDAKARQATIRERKQSPPEIPQNPSTTRQF